MKDLNFEAWLSNVHKSLQSDPLWKSKYYQLSMYLYDLVWEDCELLRKDFRGKEVVNQLVRSTGSICANVEEAYGRGIGTGDYVRIMRIALGEARETQGWYLRSRHVLPNELLENRLELIKQIISLLVRSLSTPRKPRPSSS